MIPILAQSTDLPSVPSETLKWVLVILVSLLFIAATIVGLVKMSNKSSVKIDDNPAVEVRKSPKRYNHDAVQERFTGIERRVGVLEDWKSESADKLTEVEEKLSNEGNERETRLAEKIELVSKSLDEKHGVNDKRINRINWMLAQLCIRNRITVPEEGEEI